MSTTEDMLQCECRNCAGYPAVGDNFRGYMHAPVDRSVNKPLPWIVLACILGSMSLMGVIMMPSLIDAKVRAGVSRAEALAEQARKDSAIAKDMVDIDRAKRKALEEIKK